MIKNKLPEGLLNEDVILSLSEFCKLCQTTEPYILELVEIGILEPKGHEDNWQFSIFQLHRFRKAQRLQADLKLNLAGVALSLDLLEELQQLKDHLKRLEHQLKLITPFS